MRRHDDAGRAGALGAAADGAEVVRIGDPVEHREQRLVGLRQLVRVRVAVRLDARDDALVVARPRALGQVALERRVDLRLGEPGLAGRRPLGRPDLEHLAASAQRLANGLPTVDEVAAHDFGTSL